MLFRFIFIVAIALYSFKEIEVPERKIAKEVEKVFKIVDYEFELQDTVYPYCIGDARYTKQLKLMQRDSFLADIFVRRVHTCDPNACNDPNLLPSEDLEDLEFFDYFIILDSDSVVRNITVYNYQATHGHEVAKRNWLSQFIEKQKEDILYEENIDAIAGATVSAQNFTLEIDLLIDCYKK